MAKISRVLFEHIGLDGLAQTGSSFGSQGHPSFHSSTLLQATQALSLFISSLKSICWLFHIFCSDAQIACRLFNLVRNSVIHSPSSVIGTQGTGTYPPAPVVHSEWACGTLCRRSPLPWSCRRWWVGCICGWHGLGDPRTAVVLPPKCPSGWRH